MPRVLTNTVYYTIGNIIKALASFLLLPIFANMLGTDQYGILNLLQTYSAILVVFMTLSIDRSIFRLYYDYPTETERDKFLSTIFWTIIIISTTILSINILFGSEIQKYVGNVDLFKVLLPVIIYTMLNALISYVQIILQVEQRGRDFLILSLLFLIIYNTTSLLFIFFYSKTIESLIIGNLAANIIVLPFAFGKIRKKIKLKFSWNILKNTLHYSLPLFVAVTFAWIINFTDRLFIANIASYSDAGLYSLASKFIQLAILFVGAIGQAYSPFFYNVVNTKSRTDAINILKPINNVISNIIFIIFLVIIIVSKPILYLFFNNEYSGCINYIYFLAISGTFSQQTILLNSMVYQNKKVFLITIICIIAGIISVLLNGLLIPKFGSIAAGFSNLIVGLLIFFFTFIIAKRNYYIPFGVKFNLYSIIIFIACYFIDLLMLNLYIEILLKFFSVGLLLYIAILFNLVDLKNYQFIYKKTIKPYIKEIRERIVKTTS